MARANQLFDLTDRVAIVTGGAGTGYGRRIVEALAEAGATVALTSRREEKAEKAAERLRADGQHVEGAELDLEREESVRNLVSKIGDRHKRIDILVNNAGHNILRSVESMSVAEWDQVMAINVRGPWLLSRALAPRMQRQGLGVILNISSIYGNVAPDFSLYGNSGLTSPLAYGVSKAALIQMTRYLAAYWAPEIRVNCISPGGLMAGQDSEFVDRYQAKTPLGRMAGPQDLKGAVLFLCSDASAWITGQNLIVDGGWTAI